MTTMANVGVIKREHPVWLNWNRVKDRLPPQMRRPVVGQWQYITESEKGSISIVELPNYFLDGVTRWEIYCLEGELFDGEERFDSLKEAKQAVMDYLT